jgi:hypothetical protein
MPSLANDRARRAAKALIQSGAMNFPSRSQATAYQNKATATRNRTARNQYNTKFDTFRASKSAGGRFSPSLQRTAGASKLTGPKPAPLQRPAGASSAENTRWRLFTRAANRTGTYAQPTTFYKPKYMYNPGTYK